MKGARYNFVRAARRPSEKEEKDGRKDLCISKNGRKTSERRRSRILFVRGPHASFFLVPLRAPPAMAARTDRKTGEIWTELRSEPGRGSTPI